MGSKHMCRPGLQKCNLALPLDLYGMVQAEADEDHRKSRKQYRNLRLTIQTLLREAIGYREYYRQEACVKASVEYKPLVVRMVRPGNPELMKPGARPYPRKDWNQRLIEGNHAIEAAKDAAKESVEEAAARKAEQLQRQSTKAERKAKREQSVRTMREAFYAALGGRLTRKELCARTGLAHKDTYMTLHSGNGFLKHRDQSWSVQTDLDNPARGPSVPAVSSAQLARFNAALAQAPAAEPPSVVTREMLGAALDQVPEPISQGEQP